MNATRNLPFVGRLLIGLRLVMSGLGKTSYIRSCDHDDFLSELELAQPMQDRVCMAAGVSLFSCEQQCFETGHSHRPAAFIVCRLGLKPQYQQRACVVVRPHCAALFPACFFQILQRRPCSFVDKGVGYLHLLM